MPTPSVYMPSEDREAPRESAELVSRAIATATTTLGEMASVAKIHPSLVSRYLHKKRSPDPVASWNLIQTLTRLLIEKAEELGRLEGEAWSQLMADPKSRVLVESLALSERRHELITAGDAEDRALQAGEDAARRFDSE